MPSNAIVAVTAVIGLVFAGAVVLIARRGSLSMRYTLGWLFVAACVVASGLFGQLIKPAATALDLDPVVLGFASVALLCLTVQLSITVSGLTELVRSLAEAHAILRERLDRLEPESGSKQPPSSHRPS